MEASQLDAAQLGALRAAYSRFLAHDRILLSAHSHQAWPDVARDAQIEVFDDAARWVDEKWEHVVFPMMREVGEGVLRRMGFASSDAIAFGESTHQLVFRLLSALPLRAPTRIVTTTGEFHSLYRQLSRLEEEGVSVVWVDAQPREGLVDRLLAALTPDTTLLAVSAVMFEDSYVLPRLGELLARAHALGVTTLVDAYHAFNVLPIDWGEAAEHVYVTAGGYKYAGFGNGICWLRLPSECTLRPMYSGWFADFASLESPRQPGQEVRYGAGGMRFGGATFETSALYRARAVLAHWESFGLGVEELAASYRRQTRRIIEHVDRAGDIELVSSRDDERRGAFVTLRVARAGDAVKRLRERGVWVDARGELLRVGPAPYLTDDEIDRGMAAVIDVAHELGRA